jgi:hypothetical protein
MLTAAIAAYLVLMKEQFIYGPQGKMPRGFSSAVS